MSDSKVDTTLCNCGNSLPTGKHTFAQHLRKLGLCNACYRARPKHIKACKRPDCDKRVASGYGQTAVAARTEGFCREHYASWVGPVTPHPETRSLAEIAKVVEAGFTSMDELLESFGETVEELDTSATMLERLVDQVRMKRDAVSELEDSLNKQATVVSRRLQKLAKKVLDS